MTTITQIEKQCRIAEIKEEIDSINEALIILPLDLYYARDTLVRQRNILTSEQTNLETCIKNIIARRKKNDDSLD